jgi:16S rRNA (uracil1498-N3)-methyltransferase
VERRDRSTVATFFADAALATGARIELSEDATQHARARRLEIGTAIRLTNGRGTLGHGRLERLTRKDAVAVIDDVLVIAPQPHLRLFVPVADRDRMLWLAEKCAEVGVTEWQPVVFRRSASVSPRGQGEAFMRKARARMIAAIEQSGSAWLPELGPELPLTDALVRGGDANGDRLLLERGAQSLVRLRPRAADAMVGPEGGIEDDERSLIVETYGWLPVSIGETTLRFETAGVLAAGVLRALLTTA